MRPPGVPLRRATASETTCGAKDHFAPTGEYVRGPGNIAPRRRPGRQRRVQNWVDAGFSAEGAQPASVPAEDPDGNMARVLTIWSVSCFAPSFEMPLRFQIVFASLFFLLL